MKRGSYDTIQISDKKRLVYSPTKTSYDCSIYFSSSRKPQPATIYYGLKPWDFLLQVACSLRALKNSWR